MQKLIDTLKSFGIEIPEDKQADVKKALSEHYKNAKEVAKTLLKVEGERDSWKERAETAEETLKGFDGIDPANVKTELETWKQKAADCRRSADKARRRTRPRRTATPPRPRPGRRADVPAVRRPSPRSASPSEGQTGSSASG